MTTETTPTNAQLMIECIDRAFAACIDDEAFGRLNNDWFASEMVTARELTEAAGITWDFETWEHAAKLAGRGAGQWAVLHDHGR
jgi:Leu/Phe-tRNA-protein transferase